MLALLKRFGRSLLAVTVPVIILLGLLNRCGRPNITPSATSVEGLPAAWDGSSDYQAEGWRFESP